MGRKQKSRSHKAKVQVKLQANPEATVAGIPSPPVPVSVYERISEWLTTPRAVGIIVLAGLVTFMAGFRNQFEGDDYAQIVNNPAVHSLSHISLFFTGGTFYSGNGLAPLSGAFYRPLMTTTFSLLYTLFGPHAVYFHVFQTLLFIASTVLLFLIIRKPFNTFVALVLTLLFLVHPLNTQLVYGIPSLQDVLLMFFGLLSFYILFTYYSWKSLVFSALSLFVCMLAKESAVCFMTMELLYLYLWDRKRLLPFAAILTIPVALYLTLRFNAIGFIAHQHIAPIESLNVFGRLLTIPEILLFYVSNFAFPWHIASEYYWIHPKFTVDRVLTPAIIDFFVIAFVVDRAIELRKHAGIPEFKMFTFFAIWAAVGLLPYLQVIPIDGTVNDAWFVFSMIGIVGMIGTYLVAYQIKFQYIALAGILLICGCAIRSAVRAFDWKDTYTLAASDVPNSPSDYIGMAYLAVQYTNEHNYPLAISYLHRSMQIEPVYYTYYDLANNQALTGQYAAAELDYSHALKLASNKDDYRKIEENACLTGLFTGTESADVDLCQLGINHFPDDSTLWTFLAFVEQKYGNSTQARSYLATAAQYGSVPQVWYNEVMNDSPLTINYLYSGEDKTVYPVAK